MDECIAWSTVGKNDWMDELLSRLGRGNFDIRSRLKNRELAPDQQRVENFNLRCIKYYFCCWSLTVACSHLLGKFGSKVEACAHPWNKLSELQHKQLVKQYGHLIFSIIFKRTYWAIWYKRNQNWHTKSQSTNLLLFFANSPKIPHDMISNLLAYLLQATVPDWQDQC